MNKIKVRCWKVENKRSNSNWPDCLYVTYPEDNNGHDLITCTKCGKVYAITIAKKVYLGPDLPEKLKDIRCLICDSHLADNYTTYPETYIVDGQKYSFKKSNEMPPDDQSIVIEFEGIYE